jgi:hypothetical protein
MVRANIVKDKEAIIASFFNGMNRDIANIIKLQHYVELGGIMHISKKKIKTLNWNVSVGATQSQPNMRERIKILKENNYIFIDSRCKIKTLTSYNYDINFFYCLRVGHIALQCPKKSKL